MHVWASDPFDMGRNSVLTHIRSQDVHKWPNDSKIVRPIKYFWVLTIRWQTFFWAWIAPHLRHAFSESWWHVDYYSKVEKVGCQRFFFRKNYRLFTSKKFFLEFSKKFKIYFLKPMPRNMRIRMNFEKNIFWGICFYAKNRFSEILCYKHLWQPTFSTLFL